MEVISLFLSRNITRAFSFVVLIPLFSYILIILAMFLLDSFLEENT